MHRCDLTGISCEGRELLEVPGNPALWVSPTVHRMLMAGNSVEVIKQNFQKFKEKIGTMTDEERKAFFAGSQVEVL